MELEGIDKGLTLIGLLLYASKTHPDRRDQPVEGLLFIAHSMHRMLAISFPSSDNADAAAQSSATLE